MNSIEERNYIGVITGATRGLDTPQPETLEKVTINPYLNFTFSGI
jgi:hypothetical protein